MRTLKSVFFVACISLSAAAVSADCSSANTADMNACASADFKQADGELNAAYNAYRTRLSAGQKEQLKAAQLAWIKFRDATCAFESSGVKGGSAYPMVYTQCLAEKTSTRLADMKKLAACEEGDLSCPAHK